MTGSRTSSVKIFSVSSGVGDGDGEGSGFAGSWLEICVAASANKAAMTKRPVVRFSQHIVGIGCFDARQKPTLPDKRGQAPLPDLFYFLAPKGNEQVRKGGLPPLLMFSWPALGRP